MKSPIPNWSDAKWRGWIISLLRRGTLRFPPRNEVLKEAKTEKKINSASGRLAQHYRCNDCKKDFPASKVCVDHIQPVTDVKEGFTTWDNYIARMFCPKENLQVLCNNGEGSCHARKTNKERETKRKTKTK